MAFRRGYGTGVATLCAMIHNIAVSRCSAASASIGDDKTTSNDRNHFSQNKDIKNKIGYADKDAFSSNPIDAQIALFSSGIYVVENFLDDKWLYTAREKERQLLAHLRNHIEKKVASPTKDYKDPHYFAPSAYNRYHINLLTDQASESDLNIIKIQAIQQIVEGYFKKFNRNPHEIFQSELQFIISLPHAEEQPVHCDNTEPGLTFVIPLVDITLLNGPTAVVANSCHWTDQMPPLLFSAFKYLLMSMWGKHVCEYLVASKSDKDHDIHRPLIPAGSLLIFDARTMHWGCANLSKTETRSILIFRVDSMDSPPPNIISPKTSNIKFD